MEKFFSSLLKVETFFAALFMGAFSVMGFIQVIARYSGSPLPWSEEACRFLFVWSSFLGAVLVTANNGHYKVTLVEMLPKRFQFIFVWIVYICIGVFSYIMLRYGAMFVLNGMKRVSTTMNVRMGYVFIIMPLSGLLCLVHLTEQIIKDFKKITKKGTLEEKEGLM